MGNMDSILDDLNNIENSITLKDDNGEEVKLYVLEETKLNGESYLLVSDTKDGDGECYLLRDTSKPEDSEAAYEFVDDDGELEYMSKVFSELMSDLGVDIE